MTKKHNPYEIIGASIFEKAFWEYYMRWLDMAHKKLTSIKGWQV